MADFNSARCDVIKAEITPFGREGSKPFDIADMIGSFTISQSINQVSLLGSVDVLDGVGMLETIPLRGEEKMLLKLKCYDLDTEIELETRIYKIDGVEIAKTTKQVSYTLHFITETSFQAGLRRFISAFKKKSASTIVKEIFQKYYGQISPHKQTAENSEKLPESPGKTLSEKYDLDLDKSDIDSKKRNFYLERTDLNLHITIPNYSPSEAISFVSRRTFRDDNNKSSSFRFFETYSGFYFVSDEWLVERGAKNVLPGSQNKNIFVYYPFTVNDPIATDEQVRSLIAFENPRRVDVGSELGGGAYKNMIVEYDLLRHSINTTTYDYNNQNFKGMKGKPFSPVTDVHSSDFIKETFTPENAKRFLILKDFSDKQSGTGLIRSNLNLKEIAARRTMYNHHLNSTIVSASTRGRLDIEPGQVIDVRIKTTDVGDQKNSNSNLSGKYLVHTVIHKTSDGILTTAMSLMKYDWTDAGVDTSSNSI